jgi:hypothetical protein
MSNQNQEQQQLYESPTTVVLKGDSLTVVGEYNTNLWKAVDMLQIDHGYNLDKVVINWGQETTRIGSI